MAKPAFSLDGQSLITPQSVSNHLVTYTEAQVYDLVQTAAAEFAIIINVAMQRLSSTHDRADAVKWLITQLHDVRLKYGAAVWQKLAPIIRSHSSAEVLRQCPFTNWSFEKPRGYSGDATLIDFIYQHPAIAEDVAKTTPLGRDIYEYTINAPGPVAVRERRDILAKFVDDTARRVGFDTEILAIAAGHLREAETSDALAENRLKRWVALDQDPVSIDTIATQFRNTCIEPMDGSVRGLLARKHQIGSFDLIYAAGLYDYLSDKVAIRLTQVCLEMLKPGGTFLFANFSDEMADDGYMESYMNWELLQRSEADMWRIAHSSETADTVNTSVWYGHNRNIIYTTIRKKS
ncbi:class I SAM-dependent methyltransferase (plasmid) [Aliirhizobium terrae]|uniref:class I SAM-dependent methyltransferase n=1 Tax=Terrirhizobium terrae TaxID=2926709 RepID=UPI002578D856|nr:class I SAM-dependent methyltransferase [Rhizobium sp. CC-CFT758]WJH38424.1 class I SAM-dependent methyltransferase [Rhizobium sp. CC-CFT758]